MNKEEFSSTGDEILHLNKQHPYDLTCFVCGRVIAQGYSIKFEDRPKSSRVCPADDAKEARWFPINEIR